MNKILTTFFFTFCLFGKIFSTDGNSVLLLNDTSAWYHWGCTGTSTALKEEILNLGYELTAVPINGLYYCDKLPTNLAEFKDSAFYETFSKNYPEIIEAISSHDVLVINGEGTIHGMGGGPIRLLYLAYIAKTHLKKHVEMINQSVYPDDYDDNPTSEVWQIYKLVYQNVDFIAAREYYSMEILWELKVDPFPSFDCLPLYIRKHYTHEKNVTEKNVVLAGSAALTKEGAKILVDYLNHMTEQGYSVKVLIGAKAFPKAEIDLLEYLKEFPETAKWKIVDAQSMDEWLDTINNATLLISGRFHHTIAAVFLHTPFIALNSNTPKIHGVMEMISYPFPLMFDEENLLQKLIQETEYVLTPGHFSFTEKKEKLIMEHSLLNFEGLRIYKKYHK